MKIYSKIIWDKDFNILDEESFEYNGPIAECGGIVRIFNPPPPPPPPPVYNPPPAPTGPTYTGAKRKRGKRLTAAGRGRGVLIRTRSPLGIAGDPMQLGAKKDLLQATGQTSQNVIRLIGGGY